MSRPLRSQVTVIGAGFSLLLALPLLLGAKPPVGYSGTGLSLSACPATPINLQVGEANPAGEKQAEVEKLTLKYGETGKTASGVQVTFKKVLEDSRCPAGVTCIWAGSAKVLLEVSGEDGKPVKLELNTGVKPQEEQVGKFCYRLETVNPYPQSPDPIPEEKYAVIVAVSAASK